MKTDILKVARKPLEKAAGLMAPVTSKLAKHSPEILLAGGITAIVGGAVLGSVTTWKKLPERINDRDERMAMCEPSTSKEKTAAYLEMAKGVALDYAPSALLVGGGIMMVVGGHCQLRSRIGALSAAYVTLESAYSEYRSRVVEDYGEDVDRKYRLGIHDQEMVSIKKSKNGKEKEVTEVVEAVHADGEGYSMYARYFDAFNSNAFVRDQEANFDFLRIQQNLANEKLQRKGYLFLNEVYDSLGFKEVPEGQLVGWVKGMGEDYVDFGIFEARNADMLDFVNNNYDNPNCFVLDFNVDGVMWDLI